MRVKDFDLLDDVVTSYDQTKTTIQGRAFEKTINSQDVIGPPLTSWLDAFTDAGITPNGLNFYSTNNRLFILGTPAAGSVQLALYSFNKNTGAKSYVGKIQFNLPNTAATTHTFRGLKVMDTGTTGWKIFFSTTGSVAINGGTFLVNNVDLADFVPVGFPIIPLATSTNAKAVYKLDDPANIGVGNLNIASTGLVLDFTSNRVYTHNGVSATHQYYVFDTTVSPTWTSSAVTISDTTEVVTHAGHTFLDNDPVVFTSLTGAAPLVVGTVYFVRNSNPGVDYQLSATTGGAVINITTAGSGNIGRAFGTTGSLFLHKTGNLPALTGTLLATNSEDFASPQHTSNSGFDCAFFCTTTNLYLGKLSELTSGAVVWPSLVTSNVLGAVNETTTPTPTFAVWSNTLDRAIFVTNTSRFIVKQVVNNVITGSFGNLNNAYLEGTMPEVVEYGLSAINGLESSEGWLFAVGSTTGQRGAIAMDLRSDTTFDYSYVVTKVIDTANSQYRLITDREELFEDTANVKFEYRTSGFGSISGGWTEIPTAADLSAISTGAQTQVKLSYKLISSNVGSGAQVAEVHLALDSNNEISENWEYTHDDSSTGNPSRVAFRLKSVYATSVPTLYFRAYDLSSTLVASHNTLANPSFFEYSTDGGVNWLSLGTVPNTVGTLLRYTFSTPPGVEVRPSIRES